MMPGNDKPFISYCTVIYLVISSWKTVVLRTVQYFDLKLGKLR